MTVTSLIIPDFRVILRIPYYSEPTVRDLREYGREARNVISELSKEGRSSLREAGVYGENPRFD